MWTMVEWHYTELMKQMVGTLHSCQHHISLFVLKTVLDFIKTILLFLNYGWWNYKNQWVASDNK